MKSADAFAEALKRGLSPEKALASLTPYQPTYCARIPLEVYNAAHQFGWRFFPAPSCRVADWTSLLNRATSDLRTLKSWARWAPPNWALATGARSGVFALEVDGQDGQLALITLCKDDWDWLDTLRTQAGQRRYLFFAWPRGQRQIFGAPRMSNGLRVFGESDWLPFPPSYERSAAKQVYLNPQLAVSETPPWLVSLIFEPEIWVSSLKWLPPAGSGGQGLASAVQHAGRQ